ncbi:hypothetical protein [Xanthomonas bundabergensis]|uniref:hypothetical protein n=1 Tax=Xanthomonas bundabergensis TaxID=3160842 RepID=UPI003514D972
MDRPFSWMRRDNRAGGAWTWQCGIAAAGGGQPQWAGASGEGKIKPYCTVQYWE